jgi:hypothetical protein
MSTSHCFGARPDGCRSAAGSRGGFALAALCALVACAGDTEDDEVSARHRHHDAGVDAAQTTGGGTVTCYTEGAPANTCALPEHCCFTNYSAQHDGSCSSASCVYGTISCDGPEDCPTGELCCAHAITSSIAGTVGYTVSCQASCGAPPLDREICHPDTGCSTGRCVNTYGVDNDLPRTLYVCD